MKITVFCGSSSGKEDIYVQEAKNFGALMVKSGHSLVYGGGSVGIMGAIADSVLQNQGQVLGVIPRSLEEKELAHRGVQELHVVRDMHERKALMASSCDAFVALPGGIGTLEEIFEAWTWAQLGYHKKPIAFLDINGYYTKLFSFLEHMKEEGFVAPNLLAMAIFESNQEKLLERISSYIPPSPKWK